METPPVTQGHQPNGVIVVPPGEGRRYPCGPMEGVFLADGHETGDRYAVSIWLVDPHQGGAGAHAHAANEELFFVVEGTMTFHVDGQRLEAPAGTFIRVPAGVTHAFENETEIRAGVLNIFIPGGFESRMPEIVEWFRANRSWRS